MCRSTEDGGRRCPGCQPTPESRAKEAARKKDLRHAAAAAEGRTVRKYTKRQRQDDVVRDVTADLRTQAADLRGQARSVLHETDLGPARFELDVLRRLRDNAQEESLARRMEASGADPAAVAAQRERANAARARRDEAIRLLTLARDLEQRAADAAG